MNIKNVLLATAALGVLSTSAFATTLAAHNQATDAIKFEAPAPSTVVSPAGLPRRAEGAIVTLHMTIDANGRAHDITVVSRSDRAVGQSVVAAVTQWQFTPARKNGTAVPVKVTLPVELANLS